MHDTGAGSYIEPAQKLVQVLTTHVKKLVPDQVYWYGRDSTTDTRLSVF